MQTYTDLYADTRRWVQEEWIDYICPQVYWAESLAVADYNKSSSTGGRSVVAGRDVHLYIGQATYKIGASTQSPEWNTLPQEMSNHLLFNSTRPEVDGNIYFSAKDVRANRLDGMGIVGRDWYRHPALVPPMPWIDASGPKAPKDLSASVGGSGTTVRWRAGDSTTVSYAVYRIPVTTSGSSPTTASWPTPRTSSPRCARSPGTRRGPMRAPAVSGTRTSSPVWTGRGTSRFRSRSRPLTRGATTRLPDSPNPNSLLGHV